MASGSPVTFRGGVVEKWRADETDAKGGTAHGRCRCGRPTLADVLEGERGGGAAAAVDAVDLLVLAAVEEGKAVAANARGAGRRAVGGQ